MASEKRLIDANVLKVLFDVRYDTAFIQERTRENKEQWNGYCTGINWGRNTIADAPTVEAVEVVHAEWIEGYSGREKYCYTLECSSCGFWFKTPCEHEYQIQDYKKDFEHCPCCCAIMDGGNEDG